MRSGPRRTPAAPRRRLESCLSYRIAPLRRKTPPSSTSGHFASRVTCIHYQPAASSGDNSGLSDLFGYAAVGSSSPQYRHFRASARISSAHMGHLRILPLRICLESEALRFGWRTSSITNPSKGLSKTETRNMPTALCPLCEAYAATQPDRISHIKKIPIPVLTLLAPETRYHRPLRCPRHGHRVRILPTSGTPGQCLTASARCLSGLPSTSLSGRVQPWRCR